MENRTIPRNSFTQSSKQRHSSLGTCLARFTAFIRWRWIPFWPVYSPMSGYRLRWREIANSIKFRSFFSWPKRIIGTVATGAGQKFQSHTYTLEIGVLKRQLFLCLWEGKRRKSFVFSGRQRSAKELHVQPWLNRITRSLTCESRTHRRMPIDWLTAVVNDQTGVNRQLRGNGVTIPLLTRWSCPLGKEREIIGEFEYVTFHSSRATKNLGRGLQRRKQFNHRSLATASGLLCRRLRPRAGRWRRRRRRPFPRKSHTEEK